MTGRKSLQAFQRAAGCCETVCKQTMSLALEQSVESLLRLVGLNGFPHRYQRGSIRPTWADTESGYLSISTRVVPRKSAFVSF